MLFRKYGTAFFYKKGAYFPHPVKLVSISFFKPSFVVFVPFKEMIRSLSSMAMAKIFVANQVICSCGSARGFSSDWQ